MVASLADRLANLPYLARIIRARGDVNAIWDEPWHEQLVLNFMELARDRAGVRIESLATIHPDELTQLFNELHVPVGNRVVIRRYLAIPSVGLENAWTAVQIFVMVTIGTLRFARRVNTGTVIGIGIGVGLSMAWTARSARLGMIAAAAAQHLSNVATPLAGRTRRGAPTNLPPRTNAAYHAPAGTASPSQPNFDDYHYVAQS
jgi:hypothetical protein